MRKRHYWQSWFSGSCPAAASRKRKKHGLPCSVTWFRDARRSGHARPGRAGDLYADQRLGLGLSGTDPTRQPAVRERAQLAGQFDLARNITSIWDASIVSHTGNHYVIQGDAWDSSIAGGIGVDLRIRRQRQAEIWRHRITSSMALRAGGAATTALDAEPVDCRRHARPRQQRHDEFRASTSRSRRPPRHR